MDLRKEIEPQFDIAEKLKLKTMKMNELFAKSIPLNNHIKGRIGGNPPQLIEGKIPNEYKFYITLVHPEKEDKMLSVLIHENFEMLIKNNIYPHIDVKVIEHEYSDAGNNIDKAIEELGIHSISEYTTQEDEFLFIKVGGHPRFIQYKDHYYKELEKDNYSFFLEIDEEGYSDDSDYVFMYGALYLYKHNVTGEVIAGFWQYS